MAYVNSFLVGGLICAIGQILIDKTKFTSGKILVSFVCIGCLLGGIGVYQKLIDIGFSGATVTLPGFGYLLSQGVIKEVDKEGFVGIFTGGLKAASGGIGAAIVFSFIATLFFDPKNK